MLNFFLFDDLICLHNTSIYTSLYRILLDVDLLGVNIIVVPKIHLVPGHSFVILFYQHPCTSSYVVAFWRRKSRNWKVSRRTNNRRHQNPKNNPTSINLRGAAGARRGEREREIAVGEWARAHIDTIYQKLGNMQTWFGFRNNFYNLPYKSSNIIVTYGFVNVYTACFRRWQFLIYLTQWSIDLDDLLIQNEWSNIGVSFIWDDPVYMTMW